MKKNNMFFYLVFIVLYNCNNSINSQSDISGEIISNMVGNFYEILNQGHPPFYRCEIRIVNNTNNTYLICNSEEDLFIINNGKAIDTFRLFNPILIKPAGIDTILFSFPIIKDRNTINPYDYISGDIIFISNNDCVVDSSFFNRFPELTTGEIDFNSIAPIDKFKVMLLSKTFKKIDGKRI